MTTIANMTVIARYLIEVHVPNADIPDNNKAWREGDWETRLDHLRNSLELSSTSAQPVGTTVTLSE